MARSSHTHWWHFSASTDGKERPALAVVRSFGTQSLVLLANLLTGVITARLLGSEGRGIYLAVTLWPPLLSTLAVAGLTSAVVFRMRKSPQAIGDIAGSALALGGVYGLIAIAAGMVLLPVFMGSYDAGIVLFAQLCLVNVLINCLVALSKQAFAGAGEYWNCNLMHLLPQLFHLIALSLIAALGTLTVRTAVLALLTSALLAAIVMLPRLIRVVRPKLGSFAEMRAIMSYWTRAAPTDMVLTLATYADRLVLIPLLPASQLGFYAVAYSFSRVIQFVQPAISSVFLSHLSTLPEAEGKRLHDRACRLLLTSLAAGCAILWVTGHKLLVFAYGPEFGAAYAVFILLVVEASLGVLSQITMQFFMSRDRPGVASTIQMIILFISVATLLALVPRYGTMGAALGLLIAAVLRWLMLMGALKIVFGLSPPALYPTRGDIRYIVERFR